MNLIVKPGFISRGVIRYAKRQDRVKLAETARAWSLVTYTRSDSYPPRRPSPSYLARQTRLKAPHMHAASVNMNSFHPSRRWLYRRISPSHRPPKRPSSSPVRATSIPLRSLFSRHPSFQAPPCEFLLSLLSRIPFIAFHPRASNTVSPFRETFLASPAPPPFVVGDSLGSIPPFRSSRPRAEAPCVLRPFAAHTQREYALSGARM